MSKPDVMTDAELEEMIHLIRLTRNGKATPEEVKRCKKLIRMYGEHQKQYRDQK